MSSYDTAQLRMLAKRYGTRHYGNSENPIIVGANSDGVVVWDTDSNTYIDMAAGYSSVNGGHDNRACEAAFSGVRLGVVPNIYLTPELIYLRQALCETLGFEKAVVMNSGAEAFDTAVKLARKWMYMKRSMEPGTAVIGYAGGGFHGRTIAAITASTNKRNWDVFGPLVPGFKEFAFGSIESFRSVIQTSHLGAVILEAMQGEGGMGIPPLEWLAEVNAICKQYKIMLIVDEIQTGLGRTGKVLASHHSGVHPDAVLVAKSLGAGITPISAVVGCAELVDMFDEGEHGGTYSGNPHAAAVATASLKQMIDDDWCGRSNERGAQLMEGLRAIMKQTNKVREVRGKGLFIGVTIDPEYTSLAEMHRRLLEEGILTVKAQNDTIRFTPALIITEKLVDEALERIARAFYE